MADHRNWKSRAVRAWGIAALALGLGLVLAVWGSAGVLAVTPDSSTPAPVPTAAVTSGDKDGNRIADGLEHKMQGIGANAVLRVIVTMAKGKGVAEATAAAGSFTVLRRFTIINGFTATMTRAQIQALAKSPGVVSIYDDIEVKANRADAMQAYGVAKVHDIAQTELTITYKGTGVGICIIDTGIFAGHSEFSGGKVQGFCDATNGGCFAGDVGVPAYDDNGHGTHVASIAAGNFGVAPEAKLYGAKVLNAAGSGSESDVIAGFDWCAAQPGVQVINASLTAAGSSDGADPMSSAASNAAALKVVVLAAGNTGPGQLQIGAPAAAEAPITVGAVADWKSPVGGWRKGLAVFSGRGPTADGRIKPDILAPGVDIEAAWNDGGTFVASGTSMASPFVAGVAALMLDANPALSPAAVKGIIRDTSVTRGDRSFLDAAGRPKNYDYGWGELDAYAAVAEAAEASTYTPTPFPVELYQNPTIADGASWDFEFEVTDRNTQISVSVQNGGQWITMYIQGYGWLRLSRGQDFDVQLYAPQQGPPGGTLVDESTCEIDADTACGVSGVLALWGRQETLVADPADFPGGVLPLGTWRLHVEAWGNTDLSTIPEIIDAVITLGPLGGVALPVPQGIIDGTVTDGTPGAPSFGTAIAEATVTADTGESTTTDVNGAYSLIVPAGERAITVTATGFDPVTLNNINVADGATVTENFALIDTNDPPAFLGDPIIGAATEAGTPYGSTLVGTASDPDFGDTLIFSKVSGPAWLVVASDGVLSGMPGDDDVGTNNFQVGVRDSMGSTDEATLTITVASATPTANTAPSFNADPFTGESAEVDVAYARTLVGTASDADGDPLTYSLVSAQGWLFVAPDGTLSGTPPAGDAGANAFTVGVRDDQGGSDLATLNIDVAAAPQALTGDYTWDLAQAVIDNSFTLSAVYISGESYGWNLINWPGGPKHMPTLDPVGDNGMTATLTAVKAGDLVIALTVGDGVTDASVTKTITIGSAPPPPATFGSVSGTVSDAAGGIGGATVMADTGESTTADANGLYTLTSVPTGDRTITASASGYVSDGQAVTVAENVTSTSDFTLAEAPVGGGVTVSLTPLSTNQGKTWTATVVVNVTDGGSAVASATVQGTWSDGRFENCVTEVSGDCSVSLSDIAKKTASLAYVVNAVNGTVSGASVVVLKP